MSVQILGIIQPHTLVGLFFIRPHTLVGGFFFFLLALHLRLKFSQLFFVFLRFFMIFYPEDQNQTRMRRNQQLDMWFKLRTNIIYKNLINPQFLTK